MKGRVDADIAREAAYQAWAARELLLRLYRPAQFVSVVVSGVVVSAPDGGTRGPLVTVTSKHPQCAPVIIGCGHAPTARQFQRAYRKYMRAIAEGRLFTERELLECFLRSGAWNNREEIMHELSKRGHPYDRTDLDQL